MDTSFPNLRINIIEWQAQLGRTSLNEDDQEELKDHLEDIIQELCQLNLKEDEIWIIAMRRIGSITIIEEEFEKVNPDLTIRKNGTLLIYGAIIALFLQSAFIFIPVFYYKKYEKNFKVVGFDDSNHLWPAFFYSLTFLLVCLMLILTFKGKSIVNYLGLLVLKLNMASVFFAVAISIISGFLVIQLLDIGALDLTRKVSSAFKTLTQIFYLSQIGLFSYFLLLNNNNGIRSMLSFNRKINWKTSLILGICAGIAFTFGYTYHIFYLPLIIGCPIFAVLGWMMSYSSRPLTNLMCSQLYVMILWCSELFGQYSLIFTQFYFIILCFLMAGFFMQKLYEFLQNRFS